MHMWYYIYKLGVCVQTLGQTLELRMCFIAGTVSTTYDHRDLVSHGQFQARKDEDPLA